MLMLVMVMVVLCGKGRRYHDRRPIVIESNHMYRN